MSIFKFELSTVKLKHFSDGRVILINHPYVAFYIYLDKPLIEYLRNCQMLVELNNYLLIIEKDKHWKIFQVLRKGDLGHCVLTGDLRTKEDIKINKTKIMCINPDRLPPFPIN
jgi:hypothetical protein